MKNEVPEVSAESAEMLELGAVLGQNHAFGLVAGRCSAAQAQTLRQLRDEKKYRICHPDWREFCSRYMNMSGAQADRIIGVLDEFGPAYFELAQLTRISADTYRAIGPVVKEHALHVNGEVIQLDPQNAHKVAAAIAELRREAALKHPPAARGMETPGPVREGMAADIEKRFVQIMADIDHMLVQSGESWTQLAGTVERMNSALGRLSKKNRL